MTTITALPAPPTRADPANFAERADEFLGALPAFATETNLVRGEINTFTTTASSAASTATTQAGIATSAAGTATTQAGIATSAAEDASELTDNYLGALASNPTVDKEGNALVAGDWYINTSSNAILVYTGSTWVSSVASDIVLNNTLTSTSTVQALTAAQGKVLQDTKLDTSDLTNVLTSTSTTTALTAAQGKVLQDGKLANYTITTTSTSKTLVNRERCSVLVAGLTLTLPITPTAGQEVSVTIVGSITNTIIGRNGQNIMSLAENMTIDKGNVTVTLVFIDATRGWRII